MIQAQQAMSQVSKSLRLLVHCIQQLLSWVLGANLDSTRLEGLSCVGSDLRQGRKRVVGVLRTVEALR